jgi:hypothetical protein
MMIARRIPSSLAKEIHGNDTMTPHLGICDHQVDVVLHGLDPRFRPFSESRQVYDLSQQDVEQSVVAGTWPLLIDLSEEGDGIVKACAALSVPDADPRDVGQGLGQEDGTASIERLADGLRVQRRGAHDTPVSAAHSDDPSLVGNDSGERLIGMPQPAMVLHPCPRDELHLDVAQDLEDLADTLQVTDIIHLDGTPGCCQHGRDYLQTTCDGRRKRIEGSKTDPDPAPDEDAECTTEVQKSDVHELSDVSKDPLRVRKLLEGGEAKRGRSRSKKAMESAHGEIWRQKQMCRRLLWRDAPFRDGGQRALPQARHVMGSTATSAREGCAGA